MWLLAFVTYKQDARGQEHRVSDDSLTSRQKVRFNFFRDSICSPLAENGGSRIVIDGVHLLRQLLATADSDQRTCTFTNMVYRHCTVHSF